MRKLLIVVWACAMTLAGSAVADEAPSARLTVMDAWSRATPARTGVAYLTVFNHGSAMHRLLGAETPVAERAELHTHTMRDGVMRMRRIEAVEVHPGEPAVFAPGGNHVMLIGLKEPLKQGDRFSLTLRFEQAGEITVEVPVLKAGSMGPGHGNRPGGRMPGDHVHGS